MFTKEAISIDIGSKNMNIVVGKKKKSEYFILEAFTVKTPEHAYDDGKLNDVEILSEQLKALFHDKKIKSKDLVFSLNSSAIITREIVLPVKKSAQLESMIHFEISQFLPVDLSQYIIEYKFMEEYMEDNIKKSKVLVAAVPKNIVDGYFELSKLMKMNPEMMDINANAISKLMLNPTVVNSKPYNALQTIVTVDIGYSSLNVTVLSEGRIGITRVITQGSKELDRTIAEQLSISVEEAEEIKKKGIDLSEGATLSETNELAKNSVEFIIDNWVRDIERIVKFYESRNVGKKVEHVYLYGGAADHKGITGHLQKLINIPVSTIEMINHVHLSDNLQGLNIKHYLNAIGAISSNR